MYMHLGKRDAHRYLAFRVRPIMGFYGERIPPYYRDKVFFQIILALSALAGTLLAFLGLGMWTAIASSVAAAITSVRNPI